MKALSLAEFTQIALSLQTLVGAQLQDCLQTESEFGLAFYHERETLWLWGDLHPQRPMLVRFKGKAPPRKKITRPLSLFLKARFVGRRLAGVRADLEHGRVLILSFHRATDEEEHRLPEIELRLFPRGQNVLARDGASQIADRKPKELMGAGAPALVASTTPEAESPDQRSWDEIEEQWRAEQGAKSAGMAAASQDVASIERDWKKAIAKKEKALERMREELAEKSSVEPRALGEWLKAHATLEVPAQWKALIDPEQSLSWNIEAAFRRAKDNARKAEGTRERLVALEAELVRLKEAGPGGLRRSRAEEKQASADNLLSRAEARGRRHKVGDDLEVYVGKSAADNLALLRRAQPFDYWLHLRDLPGSHAILRRARGRAVSDAEFIAAGSWVTEQSLGRRAVELKGERHDLLIVECRFVRPIKGDRLGRVHYTNDRVLTLRF